MHLDHDVVCPTLIGRDQQLAAVGRVLSRGRDGNGNVALIVGEAGVGKSRLLRAMTEEARAAGFFVLTGAAFESERTIPYAPLLDLVRLFAGGASPAVVAHVLAPAAAELTAIFPELRSVLRDVAPGTTTDPESDKRRLFHALAQVVTALVRTQPVLLAFEDVHWSDDATLDLVFHLARSHASQPVVIALTYRGEETTPRLARLVADLERARVATELPVSRLSRADVAAMLHAIFGAREAPGDEFVRLLHGLTEGNPFFVEETLKALLLEVSFPDREQRLATVSGHHTPRTLLKDLKKLSKPKDLPTLLYHIKPVFQREVEQECARLKGVNLAVTAIGDQYVL